MRDPIKMYGIVVTLASLSIINANPVVTGPRISGGENALIQDYPYQVSIEFNGRHKCSGSILSAHYVITAAHCGRSQPEATVTVRAGSSLREQGGTVYEVDKFIRHEKFSHAENDVPRFDLAAIRVKEPFKFDDNRKPIQPFEIGEAFVPGAEANVTGWGNTGPQEGMSKQLQVAKVPTIAKSDCDTAWAELSGIPKGQVCAGSGTSGPCSADSGAPLAIDGRLFGIFSWGSTCEQAKPAVYTEVAHVREWINEHVQF